MEEGEGEKGLLAIMSFRCDYSSRQRGLGLKDILVTRQFESLGVNERIKVVDTQKFEKTWRRDLENVKRRQGIRAHERHYE